MIGNDDETTEVLPNPWTTSKENQAKHLGSISPQTHPLTPAPHKASA